MPPQHLYSRTTLKRTTKAHSNRPLSKHVDIFVRRTLCIVISTSSGLGARRTNQNEIDILGLHAFHAKPDAGSFDHGTARRGEERESRAREESQRGK
jgi:hypothetical protein